MNEKISKFQYVLASAVLGLALILNLFVYQNIWLGLIAGFFYFAFFASITGRIFIKEKAWQSIFGFLFLISLISIITSGLIYGFNLNNFTCGLIIITLPGLLFFPYYLSRIEEKLSLRLIFQRYLETFKERQEPKYNIIIVLLYLALIGIGFYLMIKNQTIASIQSPWEVLNPNYLGLYFLATLVLSIYLIYSHRTKLPLILISIHYFFSSSLALIIYKIGYGFDPFIHRATEKIISTTGTINPKPLYYLGQYGVVVFLNKITAIDLSIIDKFLVPVLFSMLLPLTIFYVFAKWFPKKYSLLLALAGLSVPYQFFIMTAPQNLANLFFIITILLSFAYYKNDLTIKPLLLVAGATAVIHPLAGIPLLIALALLFIFKVFYTSYHRNIFLYLLTTAVFCLILPLVFIINGNGLNLIWPKLNRADLIFFHGIEKNDLFLNLTYLIGLNQLLCGSIIIAFGLLFLYQKKIIRNSTGYMAAAGIILVDFLLIKYFMDFPALRENDKTEFIGRLLQLSFYLLFPFYLLGIYFLVKKLLLKDFYHKIFLLFLFATVLTITFYLTYPRLDSQQPSKFYSVSGSDIKAVNYIEQTAALNHIVLANQMVGAAAIDQKGFKKYYQNQFYYSMPMGTPQTLYELYLEMIYQGAKRETMEKAMFEAGVDESYFVVNKYWRNSEKIINQAKNQADGVYSVDDGNIYIFKYLNK